MESWHFEATIVLPDGYDKTAIANLSDDLLRHTCRLIFDPNLKYSTDELLIKRIKLFPMKQVE